MSPEKNGPNWPTLLNKMFQDKVEVINIGRGSASVENINEEYFRSPTLISNAMHDEEISGITPYFKTDTFLDYGSQFK